MSNLNQISKTQAISAYRQEQMQKSQQLLQNMNEKRLLKRPPLITPEKMPKQIIAEIFGNEEYKAMVKLLGSYQKMGDNGRWNIFSAQIPADLREKWNKIMLHCRRNGFIGPYSDGENIRWRQVISKGMAADLCCMCDLPCKLRDDIDSGRMKFLRTLPNWNGEPKRCWEPEEVE